MLVSSTSSSISGTNPNLETTATAFQKNEDIDLKLQIWILALE